MMNPLVLKDTDFHNKVQMGSCFNNGQVSCYVDLEKIKQDCIRCALFWKDDYNKQRTSMGLTVLDDEQLARYIALCFNNPTYAVPFTWHGGVVVFFYREEGKIFFASEPIWEQSTIELAPERIKKSWWKGFVSRLKYEWIQRKNWYRF